MTAINSVQPVGTPAMDGVRIRAAVGAAPLRAKTSRGFSWMVGQALGTKAVNVAGQVLLAWLLTKEDFGLIASAYTISSVAGVIQQGGLREILIQRHKRFRQWANPAFWMAMALSMVSALLCIAMAPLAVRSFHTTNVVGLLSIIALSMPFSALSVVQSAYVQIELRFRLQAILNFAALSLTMALSIFFAWRHFGAYSFVMPMPLVALLRWFVLWLATRDSLRGTIRWSLHLRRWKYLWVDSWLQVAFSITSAIVLQGDYFILSTMYAKSVVGIYYFGFNLSMQTVQLVGISLAGVLVPALAQLRSDPRRQLRAFMAAMRMLAFVGVPLCFLQAALADPAMRLLFREKWVTAIPVMQILSFGMAWLLFGWQAGALLQAQRRLGALLAYGVASVFIFLGLVYLGAREGGIIGSRLGIPEAPAIGVAIGVTIAFMILAVLSFCIATIPVGAARSDVARIFIVPITLSLIAVLPAGLIIAAWPPRQSFGEMFCLILGTVTTGSLYALLLRCFQPRVFEELSQTIFKALRIGKMKTRPI